LDATASTTDTVPVDGSPGNSVVGRERDCEGAYEFQHANAAKPIAAIDITILSDEIEEGVLFTMGILMG